MTPHHPSLASGRWGSLSLCEQLANVGSEVGRAGRWKKKDPRLSEKALDRALELLDLTIADPRWKGRLKEIVRTREVLCDAWSGGKQHATSLEDLDRYLLSFAVAARNSRA